jgi:hypothetical protein
MSICPYCQSHDVLRVKGEVTFDEEHTNDLVLYLCSERGAIFWPPAAGWSE